MGSYGDHCFSGKINGGLKKKQTKLQSNERTHIIGTLAKRRGLLSISSFFPFCSYRKDLIDGFSIKGLGDTRSAER